MSGPDRDLELRPARDADAGALQRLHRAVLAEGSWFITRPDEFTGTVHSKLRQVRDLATDPCGLFLVALLGGEVVGLLTLAPGPLGRMRHAVKLEIMVDSTHRGAGIGHALMDEAMAWARATPGVHKVGLSVFADNERAIALYEGLGFEREGHRRREYRDPDGTWRDDVLMFCFV